MTRPGSQGQQMRVQSEDVVGRTKVLAAVVRTGVEIFPPTNRRVFMPAVGVDGKGWNGSFYYQDSTYAGVAPYTAAVEEARRMLKVAEEKAHEAYIKEIIRTKRYAEKHGG